MYICIYSLPLLNINSCMPSTLFGSLLFHYLCISEIITYHQSIKQIVILSKLHVILRNHNFSGSRY